MDRDFAAAADVFESKELVDCHRKWRSIAMCMEEEATDASQNGAAARHSTGWRHPILLSHDLEVSAENPRQSCVSALDYQLIASWHKL